MKQMKTLFLSKIVLLFITSNVRLFVICFSFLSFFLSFLFFVGFLSGWQTWDVTLGMKDGLTFSKLQNNKNNNKKKQQKRNPKNLEKCTSPQIEWSTCKIYFTLLDGKS